LGATLPAQIPNQVAVAAAQIAAKNQFQVLLNGVAVDASRILYVGAAPGTAGVYQINLLLPDDVPKNPEIRITTIERASPPGRLLFVHCPFPPTSPARQGGNPISESAPVPPTPELAR